MIQLLVLTVEKASGNLHLEGRLIGCSQGDVAVLTLFISIEQNTERNCQCTTSWKVGHWSLSAGLGLNKSKKAIRGTDCSFAHSARPRCLLTSFPVS
jgi:hypothetical protein